MEAWRNELYSDELYHHGILGQKWGQRRFQNKDGSLTPEGRERYGVGENEDGSGNTSDQSNKIRPNESYNKELDRISLNAQYESMMQDDYMQEQIEEQKRRTRNILIGVGAAVAVTAGGIIISKKFREARDERNALAEKLSEVEKNSAIKDSIKDFMKKSDADKAYAKTGDLRGFAKASDLKKVAKSSSRSAVTKEAKKSIAEKIRDANKELPDEYRNASTSQVIGGILKDGGKLISQSVAGVKLWFEDKLLK